MSQLTNHHNGFTLLEVLITLLILSIGLLGLAGLHITGLRLSHDSQLRIAATFLANDMAERIRANSSEAKRGISGVYHNPTGNSLGNSDCAGQDSSGNETNGHCNNSQLALHDFYEWYAKIRGHAATSWHPNIKATLPSGEGVVCVDSTPHDGLPGMPACDGIVSISGTPIFAIKIWWQESNENTDASTLQRFTTSLSP